MKAIAFYLSLPLIYLLAILPFPILYGFSNFLKLIIRDLISYRKKAIDENLQFAFPEKTVDERIQIRNDFYSFFCDFVLETLKMSVISKKSLISRFPFENIEVLEKYAQNNQSVIIALGHLGNWEWAGPGAANQLNFHFQAIYKRLLNPYFDKFILHIRSRLGVELLEMKSAARKMILDKNRCTATAFPMDQRPSPETAYWTMFMHREAGFFMGSEKIARKMDYPVIYAFVKRISRGKYRVYLEEITSKAKEENEGAIIEKFVRLLERDIRLSPETYLWSHKRWKHKKPE